jgi:hypothetical protein
MYLYTEKKIKEIDSIVRKNQKIILFKIKLEVFGIQSKIFFYLKQ